MINEPATSGVLILAAGLGQRFRAAGGTGNKLLARYPDSTGRLHSVLAMTLDNALQSGLPVHLVTRPEYHAIQALAQEKKVACTLVASGGSGESIAAGVRATPDWQGWLVQPGDMAWVTAVDHREVARALRSGAEQVRLMWQGTPGHPVGFSPRYFASLSQLQGDEGARQLIQRERITLITAHAGVIRDADLPAD